MAQRLLSTCTYLQQPWGLDYGMREVQRLNDVGTALGLLPGVLRLEVP